MASVAEISANAQTPLASALGAGLENISYSATITFTKYVRLVLPLDGFVFWVRADLLTNTAILNAMGMGQTAFGAPGVQTAAQTMTVPGSLHYRSEQHQDEDASYTQNRVVFTTETMIEDLSEISPTVSYIGSFQGMRFQFSQRGGYYVQAGLHHYVGDAVYSTMASQIVDDVSQLDTANVVVSNSLPLWLAINQFCPVFPSYVVPENQPLPYAAVHIPPESTQAIQAFPDLDGLSNQRQLMREKVRITFYGCRNYTAQDFVQAALNDSMNTDSFGLLNMPAIRDDSRTQVEFGTKSMRKVVDFEISYYQARMRNIAQQYILHAFCTLVIGNA